MDSNTSVRKINYEPLLPDFGPFKLLEDVILQAQSDCDIEGFKLLSAFLSSGDFLDLLKHYLLSPDFRKDYTPLIQDLIDFDRNYHIIKKELISESLLYINEIDTILSYKDRVELLKQQELFGFIEESTYEVIPDDFILHDYLTTDQIKSLLHRQMEFITRVPTTEDLTNNGVLPELFERIKETYFSKTETVDKINEILAERAASTVFLSYDQISAISDNPSNINSILTFELYKELLLRHNTSCSYITDQMIIDLDNEIYPNLLSNEIQVIIEREINNKKVTQEILSPQDIINIFNEKNEELFDKQKDLLSSELKDYIDEQSTTNSSSINVESVIEIFNNQKDILRVSILEEIRNSVDLDIQADCFIILTNTMIDKWITDIVIQEN